MAQLIHLGRPLPSITSEFEQAYIQWKAEKISAVEAMQ